MLSASGAKAIGTCAAAHLRRQAEYTFSSTWISPVQTVGSGPAWEQAGPGEMDGRQPT